MAIRITKASGRQEEFDIQKLINSLIRSGAPPEAAAEIAQEIERQTAPLSRTEDIYRRAKKLLRRFNRATGMRYSIKKAIFALGPSGYPFEKYFGKVLSHYGYRVETGRIIKGYCVSHEVDVVAGNDNAYTFIECKYHSDGGKATDVKTALYVHARFQDIRKGLLREARGEMAYRDGWLVTNTRCSTDALQYAECAGLRIISWRYPEKGSLERLIEDKGLYPVTVLHSLKKGMLEPLLRADIVLAQDIADMDMQTFTRVSGLDARAADVLKKEADAICPCAKP